MTEKMKPTYDLVAFKQTFNHTRNLCVTTTALTSAAALGFDRQGIVDILQTMQRRHFYKSMTADNNHLLWQDVYHVPFNGITLYVKFTGDTICHFKLLSLKEK